MHLWIADKAGTVCKWDGEGGLHEMIKALPPPVCDSKVFKKSSHSIHNSNREEFVRDLKEVIDAFPTV